MQELTRSSSAKVFTTLLGVTKMTYQYSAKNNAFFPVADLFRYEEAGWDLSDLVDVTDEIFTEFTQDRNIEGLMRTAGDDGLPQWSPLPPPTPEQILANAAQEKQQRIGAANAYINSKQWPSKLALGRLSDAETARFNLWLDYLDALAAVDTATAPDIVWPEKPE